MVRHAEFQTGSQTFLEAFLNCDLNLVSLSNMMLTETLCGWTISFIYLSPSCFVDCPTLNSMQCADFVRRLITTHTALFPFGLWGSYKEVHCDIFHFHSGIVKGWRSLADLWYSAFTCWYTRHFATYCVISLCITFYQKCCFKSPYNLVPPGV